MGFEWSYVFQKNWEGKLNQFLKNNYNPCIYFIFVDSYASQRMLKIEKRWISGEWQCTFLMEFENAGLTYIPRTKVLISFSYLKMCTVRAPLLHNRPVHLKNLEHRKKLGLSHFCLDFFWIWLCPKLFLKKKISSGWFNTCKFFWNEKKII